MADVQCCPIHSSSPTGMETYQTGHLSPYPRLYPQPIRANYIFFTGLKGEGTSKDGREKKNMHTNNNENSHLKPGAIVFVETKRLSVQGEESRPPFMVMRENTCDYFSLLKAITLCHRYTPAI